MIEEQQSIEEQPVQTIAPLIDMGNGDQIDLFGDEEEF